MKDLTHQDFDTYSKEHQHILLISPDKTMFKIIRMRYDGQSFSIEGLPDEFVTIDAQGPNIQVFMENDAIHICTENKKEWVVKELDFEYFISHEFSEEEMLKDYQAKLCEKRALELALCLNKQLDLYCGLHVDVLLRADVDYHWGPTYTHWFELFVKNADGDVYAGGYRLCLDASNDDALLVLTQELIRDLLPVKERFQYFKI